MKYVLFLWLGIIAVKANAETSCNIEAAVKYNCSHCMTVRCNNGQKGFISNDEKISSVTVRVIDNAGITKSIKLNNPPGGARDYYAAKHSDWVKAELGRKEIIFKDIFGESFTTVNAPTLYSDSNGQSPLSSGVASDSVQDGLDCSATSEPLVIRGVGPNCSGARVCHMRVKCSEYSGGRLVKNLGEGDAVCKSSGAGACPSATTCANDPDVTMEKGSIARGSSESGSPSTGTPGVQ